MEKGGAFQACVITNQHGACASNDAGLDRDADEFKREVERRCHSPAPTRPESTSRQAADSPRRISPALSPSAPRLEVPLASSPVRQTSLLDTLVAEDEEYASEEEQVDLIINVLPRAIINEETNMMLRDMAISGHGGCGRFSPIGTAHAYRTGSFTPPRSQRTGYHTPPTLHSRSSPLRRSFDSATLPRLTRRRCHSFTMTSSALPSDVVQPSHGSIGGGKRSNATDSVDGSSCSDEDAASEGEEDEDAFCDMFAVTRPRSNTCPESRAWKVRQKLRAMHRPPTPPPGM